MSTAPLFLVHMATLALAMSAARIAIVWVILQRFGTTGLSLAILTMSIGQFFGAFIAGHITDRYSRKSVALHASWAAGFGFLIIALSLIFGIGTSYTIAPILFACYMTTAVHDNAARTLIPQIAEGDELRRLNGHFITLGEMVYFAAPAIAGWAVALVGGAKVLLLAAACGGIAALLICMIPLRHLESEPGQQSSVDADSLGLDLFLKNRWLLTGIATATAANIFVVPINTLLVPIRLTESGFGPVQLGYFSAALSGGMVVGGLLKMPKMRGMPEHIRIMLFVGAAAPIYLLTYRFDLLVAIVACGLLAGLLLCLFEVNWNAMMQERSPKNMLGRIYGLGSWLSFAGRAAGVALGGFAVGIVGAQGVILMGIAGILSAIILILALGAFVNSKS